MLHPPKSSHIATGGQSVRQSWYLLLFDSHGLVFWGALSDERTGLSIVRVIVCSIKSFVIM
jgi:hypothetical protein